MLRFSKGHTGFCSCTKCFSRGKNSQSTTTFDTVKQISYTDNDFSIKKNKLHHTGVSKFEDLGVGMVTQFPLEYMHLVLLGVTKRLLLYYKEQKFQNSNSGNNLASIDKNLFFL